MADNICPYRHKKIEPIESDPLDIFWKKFQAYCRNVIQKIEDEEQKKRSNDAFLSRCQY